MRPADPGYASQARPSTTGRAFFSSGFARANGIYVICNAIRFVHNAHRPSTRPLLRKKTHATLFFVFQQPAPVVCEFIVLANPSMTIAVIRFHHTLYFKVVQQRIQGSCLEGKYILRPPSCSIISYLYISLLSSNFKQASWCFPSVNFVYRHLSSSFLYRSSIYRLYRQPILCQAVMIIAANQPSQNKEKAVPGFLPGAALFIGFPVIACPSNGKALSVYIS